MHLALKCWCSRYNLDQLSGDRCLTSSITNNQINKRDQSWWKHNNLKQASIILYKLLNRDNNLIGEFYHEWPSHCYQTHVYALYFLFLINKTWLITLSQEGNFIVCVCVCVRERERERERPVVSKGETIKHISSISAWAIHGRHPCSLLTASILQHRIEHDLKGMWEIVFNK